MQIPTIRKEFEVFDSKFESFERDSKLLNPISNHSKGIRSFRNQIWPIQKWLEGFESKFQQF